METVKEGLLNFEEIYREYWHQVVGYLSKKTGNYHTAEDLASEIFEYAFKIFDTYDSKKASVRTWLYVIVNSRFKNYLRSQCVHEDIDEYSDFIPDSTPLMETVIEVEEEREMLVKALEQLSELQRTIVVLKYFGGLSSDEIGTKLGLTSGNVRVQLFRTMDKLQKILNNLER